MYGERLRNVRGTSRVLYIPFMGTLLFRGWEKVSKTEQKSSVFWDFLFPKKGNKSVTKNGNFLFIPK
jgi:hypothetical protein